MLCERTPAQGFFYVWSLTKCCRSGFLFLMHLLFLCFLNPSQVTFSAVCKCLIYKEFLFSRSFNFTAKPLISLKKIDLHLLSCIEFLIQCKKVQLSGGKCLHLQF